MATLLERLPPVRLGDPMTVQHQRLESPPPSPQHHPQERDLATLGHGSTPPKSNKPQKSSNGKGKEVDPAERRVASPERMGDDDEVPEAEALGTYPPTNDEELETKRVEEHLRHWEQIEKQRRKAARDSRNARQPGSIIGEVAEYGSSLLRGASGRRKNSRGMSVDGWVPTKTRDSQENVEMITASLEEPRSAVAQLPPATPTRGTEYPKRPHFASPRRSDDSMQSTDSRSTVRSDPRNPFSPKVSETEGYPTSPTAAAVTERGRLAGPITSPRVAALASPPVEDPFNTPLLASSPTLVSPSVSPHNSSRATLQVPSVTVGGKSSKQKPAVRTNPPPLVRPLDLPEPRMPRMEPLPESGHWRRLQAAETEQHLEEARKGGREGRWWTDWLCGCRETSRREEQDGRTNPFE